MTWNFVIEARKVGEIGNFYPIRLENVFFHAKTTEEAKIKLFESAYTDEYEINNVLSVSPVSRSD